MNLQRIDSIAAHSIQQPECLFDKLTESADSLILFGAGQLGKFALGVLREYGIEPQAFTDNNPKLWGGYVDGLKVLSPMVAAQECGEVAFLVTVFNPLGIYEQLSFFGCRFVIPFPVFSWKFRSVNGGLATPRVDLPAETLASSADIEACSRILADHASREEFWGQINWRCTMDRSALPVQSNSRHIYFEPALILPLYEDEVFVDCGAFDGDTIRSFLEHRSNKFKELVAIEPDYENCSALRQYVESLPKGIRNRITIMSCAVGKQESVVGFAATHTAASHVDPTVRNTVPCRSLDELLKESHSVPTLIKMDIEGSEPEAIGGAAKTLHTAKPVLAVCLYHQGKHLWEIPLLIRKLAPDHRLFIRRYAEDCWELVCYAIPQSRLT